MRTAPFLLALLLAAGCKKTVVEPPPPDAGPSGVASAGAASSAGTAAGSASAGKWTIKYTLSAGSLYIPAAKDWSATKYKQDESKFLGEGTASVEVDAAGRAAGTIDTGPLAPALVSGLVDDGTLAATIRRKDPSDGGLTGTLTAKVEGGKVAGEMNLAEANAAVVRVAQVSGAKAE